MMKLLAVALVVALAAGCGSSPTNPSDGGTAVDGGGGADGGPGSDGGPGLDGGTAMDGGTATDGGTICANDQECTDGFCRQARDGGMECAAYSEEGEPCGGLVLPWAARRCRPNLFCMTANPNIADLPGTCTNQVTVATLLAAPETYRDHHVGIETAWLNTGAAPSCTQVLNDQDTPAPTGGLGLRTIDGGTYACSGAQCDMSCTSPDGRYRALGYFRRTTGGDYLEVKTLRSFF